MGQELTTANEEKKAPMKVGGMVAAFIPQNATEALSLANALATSGMTPKAYNNDPNKIMVGMMAGAEVGLAPFAALQSIAVINGNPSIWGDGALALVQASGLLEDIEETDDGETATCTIKRVDRATPIVRTFSNADAKEAGLLTKAGPWTQYRRRMRQMRARAFALRDGFADVLRGLRIAEEVRDYTPVEFEATDSGPLTAEMLVDQATEREPEKDEAEQASAESEPEVEAEPDSQDGVEGEPETEHPATQFARDIVKKARKVETMIDLNSLLSKHETDIASFPPEVAEPFDKAIAQEKNRLAPAKETA